MQPPEIPPVTPNILLRFSCSGLRDRDIIGHSDGIVFVYLKQSSGSTTTLNLISHTECVRNNLNPSFEVPVKVPYVFETRIQLLIKVYDVDDFAHLDRVANHDFLGQIECDLASLVVAEEGITKRRLIDPANRSLDCGTITISAEEESLAKESILFDLVGKDLVSKGLFKPVYFFECYKLQERGELLTYRSGLSGKGNSPIWEHLDIPISSMVGGDVGAMFKLKVLQHKSSGTHKEIGYIITNALELAEKRETMNLPLRIDTVVKDPKKPRGTISFVNCRLIRHPSFIDYVKSTQIQVHVAVDFTASNGAPSTPSSLHYLSAENAYMQAIRSVCSVLLEYDTDKMLPTYLFGGRVGSTVSHCFPLSLDPAQPELYGVEGILAAYQKAIHMVSLSGPTIFSKVVRKATDDALADMEEARTRSTAIGAPVVPPYHILLIITDGVITDLDSTIREIVDASLTAPLSIIIVGVGAADFSAMDILDGDDEPLRSGSKIGRDIVQFTPFRDFRHDPRLLAAHLLEEVPRQMLEFYRAKKILPTCK
ncbi:Copine-3 [Aduncisulcus paluster]|uniref:Copine-3 n=1 Tax=Aduncisulcus paluster TaxID=2918883 RepID=A0ABQ5JZR5_9EUKA|nr:Copine-3 [Aduncisulcus paluster]|eukprot:gnl/Carplike_NY0171/1525_a2072_718.p1 GENE.gnl/Carplike_NY0171/1525_a2072_718~~gnl/Carplike_NY0171/1525_a2072_718.p1  ORF type:complete len:539 (+),score=115.65 gnl/Carplike_NY0171/1525_a2072_718:56-1672(+)